MKVFVTWMYNVQLCHTYMSCTIISSCKAFLNFDVYGIALRQLMIALFLKQRSFWLIFLKVILLCFNRVK